MPRSSFVPIADLYSDGEVEEELPENPFSDEEDDFEDLRPEEEIDQDPVVVLPQKRVVGTTKARNPAAKKKKTPARKKAAVLEDPGIPVAPKVRIPPRSSAPLSFDDLFDETEHSEEESSRKTNSKQKRTAHRSSAQTGPEEGTEEGFSSDEDPESENNEVRWPSGPQASRTETPSGEPTSEDEEDDDDENDRGCPGGRYDISEDPMIVSYAVSAYELALKQILITLGKDPTVARELGKSPLLYRSIQSILKKHGNRVPSVEDRPELYLLVYTASIVIAAPYKPVVISGPLPEDSTAEESAPNTGSSFF
jgi:hypothetical protein